MWLLVRKDIESVAFELQKINSISRIRFAVAGHSQGGALATLTALALAKAFPTSPINLFTFSSPAIFEHDPLVNTFIRHFRFAVDNDLVPKKWFGRQHAGSRQITVIGKRAGFNCLEAHSLKKYKKVIDGMCNGNFDNIRKE